LRGRFHGTALGFCPGQTTVQPSRGKATASIGPSEVKRSGASRGGATLEVRPVGSSGLTGTGSASSMPAAGKTAPAAIKTSVLQNAEVMLR